MFVDIDFVTSFTVLCGTGLSSFGTFPVSMATGNSLIGRSLWIVGSVVFSPGTAQLNFFLFKSTLTVCVTC